MWFFRLKIKPNTEKPDDFHKTSLWARVFNGKNQSYFGTGSLILACILP
tara:strand:+ start:2011 stop:2157 length:147 start_codon:yes stop_codon:yes gene_type:complete